MILNLILLFSMAFPENNGRIMAIHMVAANKGWVQVGDSNLLWTNENGRHWQNISPPRKLDRSMGNTFFLNELEGWFVTVESAADAMLMNVFHTEDQGRSWTSRLVRGLTAEEAGQVAGNPHVFFADSLHGWLEFQYMTSSNFSFGGMLVTVDGGNTWRKKTNLPAAGQITFTSLSVGWLSGGPGGGDLYITRDGGSTWKEQTLELPPNLASRGMTCGLPVFSTRQEGILPVNFQLEEKTTPGWYVTRDGGQTWTLGGLGLSVMPRHSSREVALKGVVISAFRTAETLHIWLNNGEEKVAKLPTNFPDEVNVVGFSFADENHGWLILGSASCNGGHCVNEYKLLATTDGGKSLTDITPSDYSKR